MMNQINILFVDKHPQIRKAWDFLLGQDSRFKVVAACERGEIAIELSKRLNPDIVIIDTNLSGMSGLDATRLIVKNFPQIKVIGLSYNNQEDTAHKIILSGAMGCISKMSYPEEIFKTILEVYKGRTYICKEMRPTSPGDALVDRMSSTYFNEMRIITMNKPRLQEYAK
jgi:DNA-binding NarL/FixJ family response regulator